MSKYYLICDDYEGYTEEFDTLDQLLETRKHIINKEFDRLYYRVVEGTEIDIEYINRMIRDKYENGRNGDE